MTYQKQEKIKYPKWLKKNCPHCNYKWLEICAFVWYEKNKKYSSPIGICSKCGEIVDLEDFDFNDRID